MHEIKKDETSKIVNWLKDGQIGIMPSDTIYGLFASALDLMAVEKVYQAKGRDFDKPCIVLISSLNDLQKLGVATNAKERELVEKYWPGPLSIIFDCRSDDGGDNLNYLHRGTQTLAIRIPDDKWLLDILKQTGPLIAPSANKQGEEPVHTAKQATNIFGTKVDFVVDGGYLNGDPSTLVRVKNNEVEVLRIGKMKL